MRAWWALVLLASGCTGGVAGSTRGEAPGDDPPAGSAADRRPSRDPAGNETHDFVIRWMRLGQEVAPGVAPGFDLDAHVTLGRSDPVGCGHTDFSAPTHLGGHDGVDNQMSRLMEDVRAIEPDLDPDAEIATAITDGDALVLVRLTGVGSLVDDGRVSVHVFLGALADGGAPALTAARVGGDSEMVLADGQRFVIDPGSLVDGDPSRPQIAFEDGYIANGRVHAGPAPMQLDLPLSNGRVLDLEVRGTRLEMDVDPTGLRDAMFGGHVTADAVIRTIHSVEPEDFPLSDDAVRGLLRSWTDIDDPAGDPDGFTRCDSVSIALVFEGAPAIVGL